MAFVLADRVKETTTVTGTTSPMTLLGAATGYQTFAAIGNANVTYYTIAGQTGGEWEVGIGTYTSSGTTLSRDTVLASSNAGALVNFSAGTKDVWCDYPAGRAVQGADGYIENDATISVSSTINTGNNAISGGPLTINSGITVTVPSGSVWTVV
jgi:acetyltransferase-like isoleucine patch superfamily enzyme